MSSITKAENLRPASPLVTSLPYLLYLALFKHGFAESFESELQAA